MKKEYFNLQTVKLATIVFLGVEIVPKTNRVKRGKSKKPVEQAHKISDGTVSIICHYQNRFAGLQYTTQCLVNTVPIEAFIVYQILLSGSKLRHSLASVSLLTGGILGEGRVYACLYDITNS